MRRVLLSCLVMASMLLCAMGSQAAKRKRVITLRRVGSECRIDNEKVNVSHDAKKDQRIVWKARKADFVVVFGKTDATKFSTPCYLNGRRVFSFDVPKGDESLECFVLNTDPATFDYSVYMNGSTSPCVDPAVIVTDGGGRMMVDAVQEVQQKTEASKPQEERTQTVTASVAVDIDMDCSVDNQSVNLYIGDPEASTLQWTADTGTFEIDPQPPATTLDFCTGNPAKFTVDGNSTGVSDVCTVNPSALPTPPPNPPVKTFSYVIKRTDSTPKGYPGAADVNVRK